MFIRSAMGGLIGPAGSLAMVQDELGDLEQILTVNLAGLTQPGLRRLAPSPPSPGRPHQHDVSAMSRHLVLQRHRHGFPHDLVRHAHLRQPESGLPQASAQGSIGLFRLRRSV